MGMMDFLGKFGPSQIMDLVANPFKAGVMVAKIMPVSTHTLGRMRLAQEINYLAGLLSRNCHAALATAILAQRDVTPAELAEIAKVELAMLQMAHRLNEFRKIPFEGVDIDTIAGAYGLQVQNGPGPQEAGNGHDKAPGGGGPSAPQLV